VTRTGRVLGCIYETQDGVSGGSSHVRWRRLNLKCIYIKGLMLRKDAKMWGNARAEQTTGSLKGQSRTGALSSSYHSEVAVWTLRYTSTATG
jgi:23S rRNA maturation-related 3'-5' exoribonuclease YhaM